MWIVANGDASDCYSTGAVERKEGSNAGKRAVLAFAARAGGRRVPRKPSF